MLAHMNGQVHEGKYTYLSHLLAFQNLHPIQACPAIPDSCKEIITPLKLYEWGQLLSTHPDKEFVRYILQGIQDGFRIGYDRNCTRVSAKHNLPPRNPAAITEYLQNELRLGRITKCPSGEGHREIHISPIGIIPKKNKPGKWRLIVDLSSPDGASVNDGISSEWSSISYPSVDHLSKLVLSEGRGSYLVKADIKEAYRMVPIHPDDLPLLGISWDNTLYLDRVLPFGLRSAPKIFSAIADAIQWMLVQQGVSRCLHYLDDFILVAGSSERADRERSILETMFRTLGVPLEPSKLEGPSTCLTFLGIEVDTVQLQLRLPRDKMARLILELEKAQGRKCLSKSELQSLAGLLQHACKVVRPGRAFMRRLHVLQSIGKVPSHMIRLNVAARADITWWQVFATRWNGISMLWDPMTAHTPDVVMYSDASGGWGCGAYCMPNWFQLQWPDRLRSESIQVKELIPAVIAAAIFGRSWRGMSVNFVIDNRAVVEIISSLYSKEAHLMHLIRLLVFFASYFEFWFTASHIPGRVNTLADALSRNNAHLFLSQVPQAQGPTPIPEPLVDLLSQNCTWTSTAWTMLFDHTIQLV